MTWQMWSSEKMPIMLWEFDEAPEQFRKLSTHGGDEDWLMLIPKGAQAPYWLAPLVDAGNHVSEHETPWGSVIISAHA